MSWKNTVQEGFPGPIQIDVTYFGFLLENFNVRKVGRPPKVGILFDIGKRGFP